MTRLIPLKDVLSIGDGNAILITNNQSIDKDKDSVLAQGESEELNYRIAREVLDQPLKKGYRMFVLKEKEHSDY